MNPFTVAVDLEAPTRVRNPDLAKIRHAAHNNRMSSNKYHHPP
jgi:hypothetical protein